MNTNTPEKQAPGISFYTNDNTMLSALILPRYENWNTNTVNLNTEKQSDIIFYLDSLVFFYKYYRGLGNCWSYGNPRGSKQGVQKETIYP